jgi:alpha-D-xyloside xylohydrolase
MPYIYAQAMDASSRGLPMVRALFVEFPDDPGSWGIEDEYLFGSDMLVAPLLETGSTSRDVYLPPGKWIDYQSGRSFDSGWHHMEAGTIPVVLLVRDGAVIPHIALAQSTAAMNWSALDLEVFTSSAAAPTATGMVALPGGTLHQVSLDRRGQNYVLRADPLAGAVKWTIRRHSSSAPR